MERNDSRARGQTDKEKHTSREIIRAAQVFIRRAKAQHDPAAILNELIDCAISLQDQNGAVPPIEDAASEIAHAITLPPDVIEGVLHRGAKLVSGGASKSYKTWLLIDLGVSVASGEIWLDGYPTKQGRVLYVNLELPEPFFTKRIQTVCNERQITLQAETLKIWNLRGHAMRWPELQRRIKAGVYVLIIIDPIYKVLGGRDENKAGDIASLMNELEVLAVRSGAAVAFGAHYAKGSPATKESIDRISGSGVFARDPDSIINFTQHTQKDCFIVEMTLRNHPPQHPFVVRWDYPLFIADNTLDPTKLKRVGRPPEYTADDLLELIDEAMSAGDIVKLAKEQRGISERQTFQFLKELKQSGVLEQKHKRGKYEHAKTSNC
jgi:RecA-family ATPase